MSEKVTFYPIINRLIRTLPAWVPEQGRRLVLRYPEDDAFTKKTADHLGTAQTFLFTQSRGYMQLEKNSDIFLDLPFPLCWFERLHSSILMNRDFGLSELTENGKEVNLFGALVEEISPGRCRFMFLVSGATEEYSGLSWLRVTDENGNASNGFESLLTIGLTLIKGAFLDPLKSSDLGEQKVNIRNKIRTESGTRIQKIKKIIYVGDRKEPSNHSIPGTPINWSHAWMVRGHWRKIDGIGKDREGAYTVSKFTWVKAHTKGPEGSDIVSKIRVVKNS